MSKKHTCPRRIENGMHTSNSPLRGAGENLDTYSKGHGLISQARGCSYCGSMHPDDFMEAMRSGKELGVTDKNYKAYVDGMNGKFYYQHLSAEQRHEFIALINERKINFGYPGYFTVLPYFIQRASRV